MAKPKLAIYLGALLKEQLEYIIYKVRMEAALDLIDKKDLSTNVIEKEVYFSIGA